MTGTAAPDHQVSGAGPVRTCVGCRERAARSALLRLVAEPADGFEMRFVLDIGRSRPGRGAWIHASVRCIELAERRRSVARALRVQGHGDLAEVRVAIDAMVQRDSST